MSKRALLIACNYKGTSFQLDGCINDMVQWGLLLKDVYGFKDSDILFLRDDQANFKPTRQRILTELKNIIDSNVENIFVGYTGHGTNVADNNGDESDGQDECIVPCDVQSAGIIRDDELNEIFKKNTSNCLAIFDCCRSGTVLDLPYQGISNNSQNINTKNKLICFSGCQDNQVAYEIYNSKLAMPQGFLSAVLMDVIRNNNYYPTISDLYNITDNIITKFGVEQKPNITSSYELLQNTPFPFTPVFIDESNKKDIIISQLQQQNSQLQQHNSQLQQRNTQLQQQNSQLQQQNTQLQQHNSQLQQRNSQLQQQNPMQNTVQLQNTINNLTIQLNRSNANIIRLNQQITDLNNQKTQLNLHIRNLMQQLASRR